MATLRGSNSYRMITDYRVVKDTIEPVAMPMPNLEDKASLFAGATAWCTLHMLQGYWQVPLTEDAQEISTMAWSLWRSCSRRRRVPPGGAKRYWIFQATTGDVLEGYIDKICSVWVDDIVIWGETTDIIVKPLLSILNSLLERGRFDAAHKAVFFRKEIKWCEKSSPDRQCEPRSRAHPGIK